MNKIKYLEGLRGVASLMVVLHHFKLAFFKVEYNDILNYHFENSILSFIQSFLILVLDLFSEGNLAVWIFWVLSSYVISIRFFKHHENFDKIIISYFTKRYFRLAFPVLSSIFLSYVLLKFGFMYNVKLANQLNNNWLSDFYTIEPDFFYAIKTGLYNTFFDFNFNFFASYNSVLWTIQNELWGSFLTFSIFGIVRHNKRRYFVYLVIILFTLKFQLIWLSAFVVGHILCDYDNSQLDFAKLKNIESVIFKYNFPFFIFSLLFILLGYDLLNLCKIPSIYHNFILSIFIVYSCLRNKIYKTFFSKAIPFWLGGISFSLYLIHWPIMCSFTSYIIFNDSSLNTKIIASLFTLIILLISSFYYNKFIDKNGVLLANKVGSYFIKFS